MLAGCAELPLTEIADVHTWVAEWHYEAPEDFYAYTAFLHCGDATVNADGTGKLDLQGETPKQILVNRLAPNSDRVDGFSEEGYHTPLALNSPLDGKMYGVNLLEWDGAPYTRTNTRLVESERGEMVEITETVTLEKMGAVSMLINRNQFGCE
jgi:hypothetical protein